MHAMKKILPAAILAAFAGAAQAQVSLYGLVDMCYSKNEFNGNNEADFHSGGDAGNDTCNSTTRFGIKGSTDVGSGVKAKFKLESGGITKDGSVNDGYNETAAEKAANGNGFFNRAMWLGFEHKLGEVRLGRQDNIPFQMMADNFDFNGASNGQSAQYRGNLSVIGNHRDRQSRLLSLYTADMGGLKAAAGFQPSQDSADGFTAPTTRDTASAAVTYTAGAFAAGVSGETQRTDDGEDFASAAVSYDFKFVKLMAGYADTGSDNRGMVLGVNVPVAGFNVGTHYTENFEGTKGKTYEVWVNRELFKNTYGYVEYVNGETTDVVTNVSSDSEGWAAGVIYVF